MLMGRTVSLYAKFPSGRSLSENGPMDDQAHQRAVLAQPVGDIGSRKSWRARRWSGASSLAASLRRDKGCTSTRCDQGCTSSISALAQNGQVQAAAVAEVGTRISSIDLLDSIRDPELGTLHKHKHRPVQAPRGGNESASAAHGTRRGSNSLPRAARSGSNFRLQLGNRGISVRALMSILRVSNGESDGPGSTRVLLIPPYGGSNPPAPANH